MTTFINEFNLLVSDLVALIQQLRNTNLAAKPQVSVKDGHSLVGKGNDGIGENDVYQFTNNKWYYFGKINQLKATGETVKSQELINDLSIVAGNRDDSDKVKKAKEATKQSPKQSSEKKPTSSEKNKGSKEEPEEPEEPAKPNKGKDIAKPGKNIGFDKSKYEESFKSDYKNYF
jgi:hypothetical protein